MTLDCCRYASTPRYPPDPQIEGPRVRNTTSPTPISHSRRRLLASFGALGLGAATAGCATPQAAADDTVPLGFQWWGPDDANVATTKALRIFERRHPNIKVATSFTGYAAYFQRLATQVAGRGGPRPSPTETHPKRRS